MKHSTKAGAPLGSLRPAPVQDGPFPFQSGEMRRPGHRQPPRVSPRNGEASDSRDVRRTSQQRRWHVLRLIEDADGGLSSRELLDALPVKCAASTLYRTLRQLEHEGFVCREGSVWSAAGVPVVVELAPVAAHIARQHIWHPDQRLEELPNGGLYLSFRAPELEALAAWIASLGGCAQAVEPKSLIFEVVNLHRSGIEVHRAGLTSREELRARGLPSIPPPPTG